ncbi:uncharacterized protein LOC110376094 [Helicoverpa armigera]|uniref:Stathmin n=1 Tax=Helicoverpa armigera TaxID=29058 RepID=A0A2W1BZA8_HELAM|nr:uncharacterized protein LOC124633898 [Helicoverpa zea]XP_049703599.1 uncharacterized protein LOC110376094 [Helicoverpa armigera]PZC78180.1 hypothetical protein B5X24_HaOG202514 [Helicoverpa armigera]
MGCGSSSTAVPVTEETSNGAAKTASNGAGVKNHHHDDPDDLPTVVLPETPVIPKPPVAFEIPLEEFDAAKRPSTPPPHLQRLLQPVQPEISLPDIEEKLAEAEQRRLSILQARAASAQKRTQKIMKNVQEMDILDSEHEHTEPTKHVTNSLTIPPEPGVCEDKNI